MIRSKNLKTLYKHLSYNKFGMVQAFFVTMITGILFKGSSVQVMVDYLEASKEGFSVVTKAYESGNVCSGFIRIYNKWYGMPYNRVDANRTDLLAERHSMIDFKMPYEISSVLRKGTLLCVKNGEFVKVL